MSKKIFLLVYFISLLTNLFAQQEENIEKTVLLSRENSYYFMLHGLGWGGGFRIGNNQTALKKQMFDVSFYTMKHSKEIKMVNSLLFLNAKSYVYGKKNYLFMLQGSYGKQKIHNEKPYWGGVEIRTFYFFGPVIGFTKPVYLYIFDPTGMSTAPHLEKYNPEQHFYDNIYGRGPFFKGITEIKLHPGFHAKAGICVEHATDEKKIRALEAGAMLNLFLKPVEIMGFAHNTNIFLNLYLEYHFGKKY